MCSYQIEFSKHYFFIVTHHLCLLKSFSPSSKIMLKPGGRGIIQKFHLRPNIMDIMEFHSAFPDQFCVSVLIPMQSFFDKDWEMHYSMDIVIII